jgi:hypothetical protein
MTTGRFVAVMAAAVSFEPEVTMSRTPLLASEAAADGD